MLYYIVYNSWTLNCNRSSSSSSSKKKNKAALPRPRYGRYIPEGLPPKAPKTLSPEFPFQADRPSAELELSYHNDNCRIAMGGSGDSGKWADVEDTSWRQQQREGAATAYGDRAKGTVDVFREKVREETFPYYRLI